MQRKNTTQQQKIGNWQRNCQIDNYDCSASKLLFYMDQFRILGSNSIYNLLLSKRIITPHKNISLYYWRILQSQYIYVCSISRLSLNHRHWKSAWFPQNLFSTHVQYIHTKLRRMNGCSIIHICSSTFPDSAILSKNIRNVYE